MSVWEAIILGIVQGATEFLPVSSSGHLVLLQKIFGISEPVLVFDTALHGGTLLAVIVVLWSDIYALLRRIFQPLTLYLISATIPAVAAALLFNSAIEKAFASGAYLGFAFLGTSLLLFLPEYYAKRALKQKSALKTMQGPDKMNSIDAFFIGLFQAAAIIPGLSRSGAAISGALFRGLNKDSAARFSFLLSIPVILGALVLQAKELFRGSEKITASPFPMAAGTISACLVAFFSVRLALKIVKERSLLGFSIYTGALGFLVLIDRYISHLFF
jgi:undecaprenyl-diphosphatase